MNAIEEYRLKRKVDKIFKHITKEEPMVFFLSVNWDLFRQSVRPAIEDFLEKCKEKNLNYKQYPWLEKIREKQKELFGDSD